MKSRHPKVLSEVLFKPMIRWVTDSCLEAGITDGCAVLGQGAEEVAAQLPDSFTHVLQAERKGTGHAAAMTREYLQASVFTQVAVLNGDAPFISADILMGAYEQHIGSSNQVTVISAQVDDPYGYGRILRTGDRVTAIVEEKDASEEQRAIREISSGAFWFDVASLLSYFDTMTNDNAQGEYYLPDALEAIIQAGGKAGAYTAGAEAVLGANDRHGLARLNEAARRSLHRVHRKNGVDIPFGDGVIIGPDVKIGPDTTILPGTILRGTTVIGADCEVGPNSYLDDAVVGDGCTVLSSYIHSSTLEGGVRIGPMSNVRPGCTVKGGAKIGDFVELKNSVIGERTSVSHLTYVGDSDVGDRCNFGCGVVTVNYDGQKKHRTVVGDEAFVGCNVNLVAPVRVGHRVYAAAGTTITENVPDDALVIGRARQVVKENWAKSRGLYNKRK